MGTAPDPIVARMMIKKLNPDVITLDINMPRMNGFDFLERLMRLRPTPVVMFASLGADGPNEAVRALELGAIDVLAKPCSKTAVRWKDLGTEMIAKVKFASAVKMTTPAGRAARLRKLQHTNGVRDSQHRVIAIGASTGGVQALHGLIGSIPADGPAILIAQHMPANFTESFARRLDAHSAMQVAVAKDGDPVAAGKVYLAPGDHHLTVERQGKSLVCRVVPRTDACAHAPSVDRLFHSVAASAGEAAMGIILTGMGSDGTSGLMHIRQAGGLTITQDRQSAVIYGMPKCARESGAAQFEAALSQFPAIIISGSLRKARRITEPVQKQADRA